MIMLKKMLSLLLLGCLISQSFFCVAETYGLPELREQQFSLTDTGQIAAEIITGDILSKVDKNISGSIKLSWSDEQYAPAAKHLRDMLIEGGIAPEKVLLDHASGGFSSTANGIKILIQEIVMKLPECNYRAQGYRFDYHDEMGCAINNTRSSSIINPYKLNY
ncbi:hypothetical protein PG216_003643 [Escherichia coli]|nr:hypothetical protein [Escherichia coli]